MKVLIRTFLVLFSLSLIIFVFRKIDIDRLLSVFGSINLIYYSSGLFIIFLSQFLITYRWKLTLQKDTEIGFFPLFYRLITSYLFNNFFFGVFGGDAYKAVRIQEKAGKFFAVFSVIYNRIINTYAAALFPLLMLPFLLNDISENQFIKYSEIISGILLVLFLVVIPLKMKIINFLALKFKNSNNIIQLNEISIPKTMLISLLIQLMNATVHYIFAVSLNIEIDFFSMALIYSACAVVISIPVSINGIGVRESIFIFAFSFWNVPAETALAFSFLSFLSAIVLSLIGGFLFISENIKKVKNGQ